jgi:hypothetical protein
MNMDTITDNNTTLTTVTPIRKHLTTWLILSAIIFLCALSQFPGESQDWQNYDSFFETLRSEGIYIFTNSRLEPGFVIASLILSDLFSSNLVVYAIIAANAMLLKCWVVNQLTQEWKIFFLVTLFYLVRFAPLHELTQIRVACSSAFLLLAFVLRHQGKRRSCLAASAGALAFHVSALFIIPLMFIKSFGRKGVIITSIIVLFTTMLGLNLLVNYFQDSINIIMAYQTVGFGDEIPNPLSTGLILDWAMILSGLFLWNSITPAMKHILLIELIGMALFYGSLDLPVFSHRVREITSVLWVLFVTDGLQQEQIIKEVTAIFTILNVCLYFYLYFYHSQLFLQ